MAKTFAIEVVRGDDGGGGYGDVLARETRRLAACARDESATTLIVFENGWNDDWEGFMRGPVREAEDACEATTGGETVTVVPFHPLAAFDGESDVPPSDPRSPKWHPMRKSRWDAEVTGSEATMSCIEYGVPQIGNRITVNHCLNPRIPILLC